METHNSAMILTVGEQQCFQSLPLWPSSFLWPFHSWLWLESQVNSQSGKGLGKNPSHTQKQSKATFPEETALFTVSGKGQLQKDTACSTAVPPWGPWGSLSLQQAPVGPPQPCSPQYPRTTQAAGMRLPCFLKTETHICFQSRLIYIPCCSCKTLANEQS